MSAMSRFFNGLEKLAGLLFFFSLNAIAQAPAGFVEMVRGKSIIMDKAQRIVADTEGKRSRIIAKGTPFFVGETIQTLADGRIKIKFVEGNDVVLGSSTTLVVERASTGREDPGTSLSLGRGEIRSIVNRKYTGEGSNVFEIKTANAVAGVRGTVFLSKFDVRTQKSSFATERGAVFVKGVSGQGVMVPAGTFTSSTTSGSVIPAAPISSNKELMNSVDGLGGDSSVDAKDSKKNDQDGGGRAPASTAQKPEEEPASQEKMFFEPSPKDDDKSQQKDSSGGSSSSGANRSPASTGASAPGPNGNNPMTKSPSGDALLKKALDSAQAAQKEVLERRLQENLTGRVQLKLVK